MLALDNITWTGYNGGSGSAVVDNNSETPPILKMPTEMDKLVVYPNPATNRIHISGLPINSIEPGFIDVFDASGRRIKRFIWQGQSELNDISIAELNKGLYFLLVRSGDQTLKVLKLIKQ